jgi:hypothetical protein
MSILEWKAITTNKTYTPIEVHGRSSKKNQQEIRNNVISREEHPQLLVASQYKK